MLFYVSANIVYYKEEGIEVSDVEEEVKCSEVFLTSQKTKFSHYFLCAFTNKQYCQYIHTLI